MKLKSKPSSHKSENTYRYLKFSERLANVNIDVIHRIDRTGSYAEEVETYFFEALTKWKELNLTEHFMTFRKEVSSKCQSFNMLVFHQNAIVESLKTHLSVKNSLAYQPLLDLVVQLARDLQMDFYPHFSDFFVIITSLLDKQDTEVLEWAFTCLSYLYKYLWRMMVKDMNKIYSLYSTLLAHKKDHIRNFAAESFSFLMRKVADYDALFTLMFTNLSEHPQKAKGVGQLIFEMCRGVCKMFHSCANTALPVVLKKLGPADKQDVDLPWDSVKEALDQMVESSANYVDQEHLLPLWDSLQGALKEILGKLEVGNASQANEHLERLLYIYHTLVEHRKGAKITKPQSVCETLLHLVQTSGLSYTCGKQVLQVVTSFLMGENLSLPPSSIQDLVKKIFNSEMDRDLILSFSKEMFDMKEFEKLFLPSLLVYLERLFCTGDSVNKQLVLELLVNLILSKAPPPTDGSMAFEKYPLVFTGRPIRSTGPERDQSVSVPQQILSLIDIPVSQPLSDLSLPWAALVLLPHVRPLEAASVISAVTALLNRLLDEVCNETLGRVGLFVARQALSTLLSFKETAAVLSLLSVELVRTVIEKYPTDLSALLLGDLYYTRLSLNGRSSQISHDSLLEIYNLLHSNFSSNISKIRLLTLRIMSNFEADLPARGDDNTNVQTVFSICLQAELVPATVQDYREKLLHLRKLRHDLVQACLPQGPFHEAPLRYLIAMLFVNFRPLWDAVIELIMSHAKEMDNKFFWKVYYEHIEMVAGLAEEELQVDEEDDDEEGSAGRNQAAGQTRGPGTDVIDSGDVGVLFLDQLDQAMDPSDRTDFTNFRSLLWRAMAQFPERVEPRSRELSPLLLRFISKEFYPADLLVAPTQDLLKKSTSSEQDMGEDEDADMEEEENEDAKPFKKKLPRRAAAKQLIAHLKVFSKFSNPKALYQEPSLNKLYTELLCHKDQQIQKIALDCLMTYKDPNILPYKQNLERLLDDKHFKDEIVHFNIAEEGAVVQTSHRPQLIPMLMRILFGRMRTRIGNKFQGKAGAASRSSIVLRFLAGCQPEEMGMFIDLLLEPVCHHGEGPCLAAVERAVAETDPSAVLPVGRQHSLLNIIDIIIHKLGHLIHIYLPKVLQILLCITASVSLVLDHREQLKPGCISPLKNLRRLGILRIQDFFDGFESYSFTADELDAVFEAVVWPQVCRLPTESTYAPTPLLKLIHVWSQNIRFFPLLGKQRSGHPECDVLRNVFALLSVKNVSPNTVTMVMDIVESLLSTPDFVPTENESELIVNNCVMPEPEQNSDGADSLTMGCRLLLPHVPAVLGYLSGVVRNSERLKKKKFRPQVSKELNILSKISRFVTDRKQSSVLITLLLPYLHKPKTSQETELDILDTVQNLLRQCSDPAVFLKPLSKLLSIIQNKPSRKVLCNVFKTLSDLNADLTYITDSVIQLNTFDSRHLDEIHFDVRLMAFQNAMQYIKEMSTMDLRFLTAAMHNCFHSIQIGDMSLADCATMCLSVIITQLSSVGCPEADYKEIVQYIILDAVRKGLKNKTESVRNEYTTVLSCLVKTFPNRSEFRDLVQLTDYNDPESDFFEHMKHIQVHRRGRALRKFAKQLTEGTIVMSARSMQNYIMPYAMIALFDEKLLKYEPMTTAAVELISAVCRRLTWSKYLFYLKHFIHVLHMGITEQKLAVSLLVTVLDAFHFDHQTLSKEIEAAKNRQTEPIVVEEAEDEAAETMETDESDDEGAMETNDAQAAVSTATDAVDVETQDSVQKAKKGKESQVKKSPPVVSSGLPQSHADLEALISSIYHTVTQSVLPKLHKCLTAKVKRDDEHKAVKSNEVKDDEVVRVPIAFAMVQLMKSLPQDIMEANLPGVLLKVCVHLKSRFEEIREVARSTLVKIIETLGHQYLHYLLREMQSVLAKGFQVHVLTFTVYHLLSILRPTLTAGDLDPCMDMLIVIFNNELFGEVAEEKDVKGIVSKLTEARHSKSSDSYELLARFCSQERVVHLVVPLKEILENTVSLKVSRRVHAVFRRIVAGLLQNQSMSPQSILLLSHGLVSQSLPLITSKNKEKVFSPPDPRLPPPSCLLLPPTPKRGVVKAAINRKTNTHILVETGLSLLHCSLKTSKVNSSVESVKEMLDPFVCLLLDCLSSMHVKVITEALQAFIWILKFPLPAVELNFDQLTKQLFVLLKDYAKAGAARGENFHLVQNCFKAITVLVKSATKRISETQLQVLLGYAEEDIYDNSRRATAFGLLRAILFRKLVVPEMEEVMKKVAKLSINGATEQVRVRCRQIYLRYLMDYPLGKKLKSHFDFIVAQISYEYDTGRQSSLEMLAFIFQTFPQSLLHEYCGLFFVPLSLAILNDDSASCKKMAALAVKSLLNKLDLQHQNNMFNLVNTWLTGEKMALRRLGTQMCGLFVEVEGEKFSRRLETLIPLMEREIHTSNFEDIEEEENEKAADRLLFSYLTLMVKLIKECNFLELHKPADQLNNIWGHIEAHLRYPHSWVWLTASQIYGLLFAAHKPEDLVTTWSSRENTQNNTQPMASSFLSNNLASKMRELVLSFCYQMQSKYTDVASGEQVIKNLIYVAKVIYLISPESDTEQNEVEGTEEEQEVGAEDETTENMEENEGEDGEEMDKDQQEVQELEEQQNDNRRPSLLWVMKKLSLVAKREAANTPKVPLKRTCVFKFLGAIAVDLGKDRLGPYLTTIIAPLYRELDSTYADQDPTLKNLAQELIELLKKMVGVERFSLAFVAVQKEATERRASRKKHKAMQAVVNPDIAAKNKIKKQLKKNEAKKRKIQFVRTGHKTKKHKSSSAKDLAIMK